jgi:hypothetical protein
VKVGIQGFFLKQAMIDGEVKMDSRFRGNDVVYFVMPAQAGRRRGEPVCSPFYANAHRHTRAGGTT